MKFSKSKNIGNNKTEFEIRDSTTAFANTLRQTILEEIPTMAINEVDIYKNTTSMFDEYISHRLGMIPLKTNLKSYVLAKECCGGNCNKCSTTLKLEAKGPKIVYSGDFKASDKTVEPVYDNIPIMKLAENEELQLEAKAVLGIGKDHAKWQSALAYYKLKPEVKIDNRKELCPKAVEVCPANIIQKKGKKLEVTDENKCIECMECVKVCPDQISIGHSKTDFIFTIETYNNLKPKEILNIAMDHIKSKTENIEKQLK